MNPEKIQHLLNPRINVQKTRAAVEFSANTRSIPPRSLDHRDFPARLRSNCSHSGHENFQEQETAKPQKQPKRIGEDVINFRVSVHPGHRLPDFGHHRDQEPQAENSFHWEFWSAPGQEPEKSEAREQPQVRDFIEWEDFKEPRAFEFRMRHVFTGQPGPNEDRQGPEPGGSGIPATTDHSRSSQRGNGSCPHNRRWPGPESETSKV